MALASAVMYSTGVSALLRKNSLARLDTNSLFLLYSSRNGAQISPSHGKSAGIPAKSSTTPGSSHKPIVALDAANLHLVLGRPFRPALYTFLDRTQSEIAFEMKSTMV
jgi:hypothetical protein